MNALSKKEMEIMAALWENGAMTKAELENKITFLPATIFRVINGLIKKSFIFISGSILDGNIKSRLYSAEISEDEYNVMITKHHLKMNKKSVSLLVSALVDESDDEDLLDELEKIIKNKRK